jgi:hypothetical protein
MSDNQASKRKSGRADDILIYVSGTIWIVIILLVVGFLLYVSIDFAMLP